MSADLESPPRDGRQSVNIMVDVSYQDGDHAILINEAFTLASDDHLFSAADALRNLADRLEPRGGGA